MTSVDIAVFAHNEEKSIEQVLDDLAKQTILKNSGIITRVRVLCNGCTDNTVKVAREAVAARDILTPKVKIYDFQEGGKSRTWNRFVSDFPEDCRIVVFMDADIRIPDQEALLHLVEDLSQTDGAVAITSRPVKDLRGLNNKPLLRAAAGRITRRHEDGPIAGSLYAVKAETVRQLRLPVPCLVEDGFLSACLVTSLFSHGGKPELVKASQRVTHYFEPPGSFREFFRHDVRLALGCELNAALYTALWAAGSNEERLQILRNFSESSGMAPCIDEHLEHPERSALKAGAGFVRRLSGQQGGSLFKKLALFPVRFAHAMYMEAVRCRGRELFRKRQFQW